MPSVERIIWNNLGIHRGDSLPATGMPWTKTSRNILATIFKECGFTRGAEVGVEEGKFSRFLCDNVPGLSMLCVDPWRAYHTNSQEREDRMYSNTVTNLQGRSVTIMRKTSLEASLEVADASLDFVYIDALHDFDGVMMDIILWGPKVRSGGIISGHDYVNYYSFGVIQAVRAYVEAHRIGDWYVTTESIPSWLFVKNK